MLVVKQKNVFAGVPQTFPFALVWWNDRLHLSTSLLRHSKKQPRQRTFFCLFVCLFVCVCVCVCLFPFLPLLLLYVGTL
jgi:hypothetical protein